MGCGRLFEGSAAQMFASLNKFKTLPIDTRIYCAHEYAQANARFALSVEPDNENLQSRMVEINQLRKKNLPTIPTTLELELATNPFLRTDSSNLQHTINLQGKSEVDVFTWIRELKDKF